jgi:Flp pilus assembly protein TadB
MAITLTLFLVALLMFLALKTVCSASKGHSCAGYRTLSKISGWQNRRRDVWASPLLKKLTALTARAVLMDETTAARLRKALSKAGLALTPQEYTARKYLIVAAGIALALLCCCLNFLFGAFVAVLGMIFALMKQRDTLDVRIRKKERIISQEMPRFVRTICRSLQSDRDLYNVIDAYRKVAGPELGGELDILLTEMKSGNVQTALIHFENRLGSPEAFRLCAALRDMSLGIDQTATLSYMADDMARQSKENIRKELSLRPGKMRRTYYPAIGVCIAMIMYVLVVYVINNLNSIV